MILTVRRLLQALDALEYAGLCPTHGGEHLGACSRCGAAVCARCVRAGCPHRARRAEHAGA